MLFHLLLALATVVLLGRLLGLLFRKISQPPVIGEVLAGILLGPSLLGFLSPPASQFLMPPAIGPHLNMIAQFGIILYMFLIGLDLNTEWIRNQIRATIAISAASILIPFALGIALATFLFPYLGTEHVSFLTFALFLGLAMSITAFPVLARILSDTKLIRTEIGNVALACASVNDVAAWCLLAFVVGTVKATTGNAIAIAIMTILFILFFFLFVRRIAWRFTATATEPSEEMIAIVLVAMLASSLIAEAIGIHAVFGAFLLGAIIPHDSTLARAMIQRLEEFIRILLLPAFFAFTGMQTEIRLLSGLEDWLICALIIVVATTGKFGGTFLAARRCGMDHRSAVALGALMNARGLMELIVLNVGLQLGVLSQKLFTMMVLMALATTISTAPLVNRFTGSIERKRAVI